MPNIFTAKPVDYVNARERIYHTVQQASYVDLPVAP